jgi:hypothetical protein
MKKIELVKGKYNEPLSLIKLQVEGVWSILASVNGELISQD